METAAQLDLEVPIGGTCEFYIQALNNDDLSAFDLTGSELIWTAVDGGGGQIFSYSSATDAQVEITDAVNGNFTLSLDDVISALVPIGRVARHKIERKISTERAPLIVGYLRGDNGGNPNA